MNIHLDRVLAILILGWEAVCLSEGCSDLTKEFTNEEYNSKVIQLLTLIKELYPDLAEQYSYVYDIRLGIK